MRYTELEEKVQAAEDKAAEEQNNNESTILMIRTSEPRRRETDGNSTFEEAEILATEDREEIEIQQITITS